MSPAFYPDAGTAVIGDTQIRIWRKLLGLLWDNTAGAAASLAPRTDDTLSITKKKYDYLKTGTTSIF